MNSFIEFYGKHRISPVSQDIRDLTKHFSRRQSLYRQLEILPALVRGRTVLEIGPGSGFNSLYTAALKPAHYVMVEGNPTGVERTGNLLAAYGLLSPEIDIVPALIEDFTSSEKFDLVLCEGMLSGVVDPEETLKRIASFVDDQGVLVITCADAVSDFPESLRHLYAQVVIDPLASLDEQVDLLMPLFGPHLAHLAGMSRPHRDWIIDNLLNPAAIGSVLPISTAIATLEDEFEVLGSSPHFLADWRWYKDIFGTNRQLNARGVDQYWRNLHSFLNYDKLYAPRPADRNRILYAACMAIRENVARFTDDRSLDRLTELAIQIEKLSALVAEFCNETADALKQFVHALRTLPADSGAIRNAGRFAPWFGRGQQYVSFTRHEILPIP